MKSLVKLSILLFLEACFAAEVLRPRGVSLIKASLYDPGKDFQCLDGSSTVPFIYVNDDYCDCRDGSDEPGTSACPNGSFHCSNVGHSAIELRSSRVNDGVCDCCDGSDEWTSRSDCRDVCLELGRAAREEAMRLEEETKQGSTLKLGLIEQGKNIRMEKESQVAQIQNELMLAESEKAKNEEIKRLAEEPEQQALERYRGAEEAKKEADKDSASSRNEAEAKEAFDALDKNLDGQVSKEEIQQDITYDTNRDGTVSDDEAGFYTQMSDSVDFATFSSQSWRLMRPAYAFAKRQRLAKGGGSPAVPPSSLFTPPSTPPPPPPPPPVEEAEVDVDLPVPDRVKFPGYQEERQEADDAEYRNQGGEGEEDDEYDPEMYGGDDERDEEGNDGDDPAAEEEHQPDEIVYDEQTQALVDAANQARKALQESVDALKDLQRRLKSEQESLSRDFGPSDEYRPLEGSCYELTDREYTYKLCPFEKATQSPRGGGGETRLGSWGEWVGEEGGSEGAYSAMKYTNGQGCWNGPNRSTLVKLHCGVEHKLISATEPSKCEYMFVFVTPAACAGGDGEAAAARAAAAIEEYHEEEEEEEDEEEEQDQHTEL